MDSEPGDRSSIPINIFVLQWYQEGHPIKLLQHSSENLIFSKYD